MTKRLFSFLCFALLSCGVEVNDETRETLCVVHLECPIYDRLARITRLQGEVKVKITIGPDGKVLSAAGVSGHPLLVKDVEQNIRKWTFIHGSERTFEVLYDFRLEEPEVYEDPPSRVSFDLPYRVRVVSNFYENQPQASSQVRAKQGGLPGRSP